MFVAAMLAVAAICFLDAVAVVHADDALVIPKGGSIEHAAGDLWRVKDSHGTVTGYIERDKLSGQARVTDRSGNTTGYIDDELLDLDSDDSDCDPDDDCSDDDN